MGSGNGKLEAIPFNLPTKTVMVKVKNFDSVTFPFLCLPYQE